MSGYVLGHEDRELERLMLQAAFYRPLTEAWLRRAGIAAGMRVLDVGAGAGDVSLLLADLGCEVVGIDRSAEACARATRRARPNMRFVEAELESFASDRFDAVVGRLILTHQADPAAALAHAIAHARPGGIVAFQEMELAAGGMSYPRVPLFERAWGWVGPACERAGLRVHMAMELAPMFARTGLVDVGAVIEGAVGSGPDSPAYAYVAETSRSLLPIIEKLGVATAAEIDVDTLAARLRDETVALGAAIVPAFLAGAWGRRAATPGS